MFSVVGGTEAILGENRFVVAGEAQTLGDLGDAGQGFHQGTLRSDGRGVHRRRQGPGLTFEGETVGQGLNQGLHAVAVWGQAPAVLLSKH